MTVAILKLRHILLTSIQVDMSDEDAADFQLDVLREISDTDAKGLVIDITALDVVDSFMARVLNDAAQMVRTLGVDVVISGMQPSVALTLIEMGRELVGVPSALNLDHGVEKLRSLIAQRLGDDG